MSILIKDNIACAVSLGRHVELTTLVVPGFNDDEDDLASIVSFISSLDRKIPFHITRFFPAGDMRDARPTELGVLYGFRDIAKQTLENVFLGNV